MTLPSGGPARTPRRAGSMRSILDQWHDTIEAIERLARVRTLLDELDDRVQRSIARAEEGALMS